MIPGITRYQVYAAYGKGKFKKIKTVKGTSAVIKKLNGKKLKKSKTVRLYVTAYGKNKELVKSMTACVAGPKSKKYTNAKAVTVSPASIKLKLGKSETIHPKETLADKSRKKLPKSYAPAFRYATSDMTVAVVDKNGKITGKERGSCYVYAFAANGLSKKVKVDVD